MISCSAGGVFSPLIFVVVMLAGLGRVLAIGCLVVLIQCLSDLANK